MFSDSGVVFNPPTNFEMPDTEVRKIQAVNSQFEDPAVHVDMPATEVVTDLTLPSNSGFAPPEMELATNNHGGLREQWESDGRMDIVEEIGRQLLVAIEFIHSKGVLHRGLPHLL
jgi:hypothetical protein